MVALLGTSGGDAYLEGDGAYREYSSDVQAVVDLFGPTDFTRMNDRAAAKDYSAADSPVTKFLGKSAKDAPELAKKASPITYVSAKNPPVLLIHGEMDDAVIIEQSEIFYDALVKAGVKTKFVRVKNAGHGLALAQAAQGAEISPSAKEVEADEVQWFKDSFQMK